MFANCYIQGDIVTAHDCPAGWTYQQDHNQCLFAPSSWEKISTVKSCAASNNCPSPEIICGNPTVRIGLHLMINCILQGDTIDTCPAGWKLQYHNYMKQCLKQGENLNCGNSVGISCTNSTQNCTVGGHNLGGGGIDFGTIFALPISIFVIIILIIVVKVRRDLKKKK